MNVSPLGSERGNAHAQPTGSSIGDEQPRSTPEVRYQGLDPREEAPRRRTVHTVNAAFDSHFGTAAAAEDTSRKPANQQGHKDGKLGLGFSRSPPRKGRGGLQSHVDFDNIDIKMRNNLDKKKADKTSGSGTTGGEIGSLARKPKSFEKTMSGQSGDGDTPSRPSQPRQKQNSKFQHVEVAIPARKAQTLSPHKSVDDEGLAETVPSTIEPDASDGSSEEASPSEDDSPPPRASKATVQKVGTTESSSPESKESKESSSTPSSPLIASKSNQPRNPLPAVVPNELQPIIPPGHTIDTYRAWRTQINQKSAKADLQHRLGGLRKSSPPTVDAKPATKTKERRAKGTVKAKDVDDTSSAAPASKIGAKRDLSVSKAKHPPQGSRDPVETTWNTSKAPAASKGGPSGRLSVPAKNGGEKPPATHSEPTATAAATAFATLPVKSAGTKQVALGKKPTTMDELKAQREAERAKRTAASSKTPHPANLKHPIPIQDSDSESESDSETETETETSSSDQGIGASQVLRSSGKKLSGLIPTIDLTIRDPSPSSGDDQSE